MLAESMLGESGRQIDRDKIHRVHEDNPNEHRQRERRHECPITVKYGFYLVVDKFEQQFDYRLPPVGNASRCAAHDPEKKSKLAEIGGGKYRIATPAIAEEAE